MQRKSIARVAKLVDAPDLGSGVLRRVGSSPITRTMRQKRIIRENFPLFCCNFALSNSISFQPANMKKDNNAEIFPIVDEDGCTIGSATRGECHNGSKLLHPVVHLHLLDSEGRLYLQQRPLWKEIQPGKWDTAVGGHIDYGEDVEAALMREAREEIGIELFAPQFLMRYVFESEREKELVHVFCAVYTGEIMPSDELDGGRFWNMEEIEGSMGKGILTPNFEQEFGMLKLQPGFPPTAAKTKRQEHS